MNPHDADVTVLRGYLLLCTGRPTEALEAVAIGRRLNPTPPQWYRTLQGLALYMVHRYAEAAEALERMIGRLVWDHAYLEPVTRGSVDLPKRGPRPLKCSTLILTHHQQVG